MERYKQWQTYSKEECGVLLRFAKKLVDRSDTPILGLLSLTNRVMKQDSGERRPSISRLSRGLKRWFESNNDNRKEVYNRDGCSSRQPLANLVLSPTWRYLFKQSSTKSSVWPFRTFSGDVKIISLYLCLCLCGRADLEIYPAYEWSHSSVINLPSYE